MKILMVVHGFVPEQTGGVELRCFYLARELAKEHDVRVFTRTGDASKADYELSRETIDGIAVTRAHYNFGDCTSFRDIYVNERMEKVFEDYLDDDPPDVVHVHHLTCLTTTIPAALQRRDIATVMSLHDFWLSCPRGQIIRTDLNICDPIDRTKCLPCLQDLWPHFPWPKRGLFDRLLGRPGDLSSIHEYEAHIRGVLATPDRLFAPCDFHRNKFIELGAPKERIQTMAYGFDKTMFEGVAAQRKPADKIRIGYIGSVIPTKGVHVLLDAFEGIDSSKATLDIYGEIPSFHGDTSYAKRIEGQVAADESVTIHGRYENRDLPDILSRIDILVVPSVWYETFSITIREGFLAGIPVVASRLGAMGEAFEDEVSGLYFTHGDASDLRTKLARLVDDADLRERLVAAPKTIKDIGDNAQEIAAIYEELASAKRSATA